MPSYKYEVIGPDGKPQTGTIDASNLEVATAELKSGGNTIVSLSKANAFNKDLDIHIGKAVSVRELSVRMCIERRCNGHRSTEYVSRTDREQDVQIRPGRYQGCRTER